MSRGLGDVYKRQGISSALNLSNQGLSITILEANKVGSGASGRNGGQLGIGMREKINST